MRSCWATLISLSFITAITPQVPAEPPVGDGPEEFLEDPYIAVPRESRRTSPGRRVVFGRHRSIQVNVDQDGQNILGDAANEPSIAMDPTDPSRMAIGWRQFDTVASNFRQAGYGFTTDGGASWIFPGVIKSGVFRSDPVLDFDAQGTFFYNSLAGDFTCDIFRSGDGGASWDGGVDALGGDKQWMSVDRGPGSGEGNIYIAWWPYIGCCFPNMFSRSSDSGASFDAPIAIGDGLRRGTTAVAVDGAVFVTGHLSDDLSSFAVAKATTLHDPSAPLAFDFVASVDLGGSLVRGAGPNPAGLLGQVWVVADPRDASRVYVLASIDPPGKDPLDVHFVRSLDGGTTWSSPVRINDEVEGSDAWQWFATLSAAPDGRLDAVWSDTRGDPGGLRSVLYYSFSEDGGLTWSANEPLTPAWDPLVGFPQQKKIGDYYESISTNDAVHLAYAATFNGEQDIYYLRIVRREIFADGFEGGDLTAWSRHIGRVRLSQGRRP